MLTIYQDATFERHETGRHPESPSRIRAIRERLTDQRIAELGTAGRTRKATIEEVCRIHQAEYVQKLDRTGKGGGGRLDVDTVMSAESFDVALLAAGTAIAAVDEVLSGKSKRALALVRPPGHHALTAEAMGFCLFNNVAVAAAHARSAHGLDRVLIVDWDIHHGNGTQDIFYGDGQVVFFSSHRYPFYPGTGAADETGTGEGLGAIFNLPCEFGIARKDFLAAFASKLAKAVRRAKPQLILVSAGFDAHREDPVGNLGLETEDFEELTGMICRISDAECGGKIVSLLEGGYNVQRLAECVDVHAAAMARNLTSDSTSH